MLKRSQKWISISSISPNNNGRLLHVTQWQHLCTLNSLPFFQPPNPKDLVRIITTTTHPQDTRTLNQSEQGCAVSNPKAETMFRLPPGKFCQRQGGRETNFPQKGHKYGRKPMAGGKIHGGSGPLKFPIMGWGGAKLPHRGVVMFERCPTPVAMFPLF